MFASVQFYARFLLHKPPLVLQGPGPLVLTGLTFLASAFTYFIGCRLVYNTVYALSPQKAKSMRQTLIVAGLDPLADGPLHGLHGFTQDVAVVCYCTLLGVFAIITVLTGNVGVFAFAGGAARAFLKCMEIALGEMTGTHSLRRAELGQIAERLRQNLHINISSESLSRELDGFLAQPSKNAIVQISNELFILLAAGTRLKAADSNRMRYVIVTNGFVQMTPSTVENTEKVKCRRDLIIDLFTEEVKVAGLGSTHVRWFMMGKKVAWHLALSGERVQKDEYKLVHDGMPQGAGCFSWASSKSGWAFEEAFDPEDLTNFLKELKYEDVRLAQALHRVQDLEDEEDVLRFAQRLVNKGAIVDWVINESGWTPLHASLYNGYTKVAKMLVRAGADMNLTAHSPDGWLTPLEYARNYKSELAEVLDGFEKFASNFTEGRDEEEEDEDKEADIEADLEADSGNGDD
eukprot:NODE_6185_length_1697_cov_8.123567.p1 GENE.NODE_6185_length_1697_cov_8.123567~~NODE_6185_length_1697_cov_8.123567.p1  ORF type:complete len:483 (-),score=123.17 NODE_6185_length_1697_cov_8.123567:247-1629(-)